MTKLGQGRRRRDVSERGFTLVEVSIIVMALAILSAILLPQVGVFLRDARFARVREDVAAIGAAMMHMLKDTGESSFHSKPMGSSSWRSPERYSEHGDAPPVGLLIGDGDTPDGGSEFYDWREPLGSTVADAGTDFPDVRLSGGIVDTFANHLIQNYPGDSSGGTGPEWKRYRTPADMVSGDHSSGVPGGLQFDGSGGQGFNSEFAWRGPYLDGLRPDPWGNRYMSNVAWLTIPQGGDSVGFIRPVIVLSAGPDEEVDTPFASVGGFVLGDDDIAFPVSYGSLR